MSREWVKMRSHLRSNFKVVQMVTCLTSEREFMDWLSPPTPTMCDESVTHTASHRVTSRDENVTARVTVCGLLDVWAAVNEAIDPTTLAVCGVRICDIDTIAGIPCFGRAMEAAGWAIHVSDPLGVIFPNFLEFNTPDAIRNSPLTGTERMRQKRARDREKTGVTNVTKCDVDKSRIEKSIDENTSTYFHLATNKSSQREDRNQRPKTEHAKTLGRALAAATKFEPMSKADHARLTRLGKVLADAAATEEEIAARAARFGRQWNVPITPEALVKHWGSLSGRQMRIKTAAPPAIDYSNAVTKSSAEVYAEYLKILSKKLDEIPASMKTPPDGP